MWGSGRSEKEKGERVKDEDEEETVKSGTKKTECLTSLDPGRPFWQGYSIFSCRASPILVVLLPH